MSKTTDFGNTLKQLIKEKHITQVQLAEDIKVGKTSLSMYVTGQQLPRYDVIKSIADYFGVSIDYLLGNENKPKCTKGGDILYIPVITELKYGDAIDESNNNIERYIPIAKERFAETNTLFFYEVNNLDMYPLLLIGDLVLFEAIRPGIDKINTGDICLCTKANESAVIREMVNTTNGYVFNLMNVQLPPRPRTHNKIKEEDINIIAKAKEIVHILPDRGNNNG